MSFWRPLPIDNSVFFSTICLLVLVNVSQYVFSFGILTADSMNLTFGFPCSYYSESLLLNRGRVLYLGIIGDLMFALILGCLAGYLTFKIKGLVRRSDFN